MPMDHDQHKTAPSARAVSSRSVKAAWDTDVVANESASLGDDELVELVVDEVSAMIDEGELTDVGVASTIERWHREHDQETANKMVRALTAICGDVRAARGWTLSIDRS